MSLDAYSLCLFADILKLDWTPPLTKTSVERTEFRNHSLSFLSFSFLSHIPVLVSFPVKPESVIQIDTTDYQQKSNGHCRNVQY